MAAAEDRAKVDVFLLHRATQRVNQRFFVSVRNHPHVSLRVIQANLYRITEHIEFAAGLAPLGEFGEKRQDFFFERLQFPLATWPAGAFVFEECFAQPIGGFQSVGLAGFRKVRQWHRPSMADGAIRHRQATRRPDNYPAE